MALRIFGTQTTAQSIERTLGQCVNYRSDSSIRTKEGVHTRSLMMESLMMVDHASRELAVYGVVPHMRL